MQHHNLRYCRDRPIGTELAVASPRWPATGSRSAPAVSASGVHPWVAPLHFQRGGLAGKMRRPRPQAVTPGSALPACLAQTIQQVFVVLWPHIRRPVANNEVEHAGQVPHEVAQSGGSLIKPPKLPECCHQEPAGPEVSWIIRHAARGSFNRRLVIGLEIKRQDDVARSHGLVGHEDLGATISWLPHDLRHIARN